jgi:hypothetical protein
MKEKFNPLVLRLLVLVMEKGVTIAHDLGRGRGAVAFAGFPLAVSLQFFQYLEPSFMPPCCFFLFPDPRWTCSFENRSHIDTGDSKIYLLGSFSYLHRS